MSDRAPSTYLLASRARAAPSTAARRTESPDVIGRAQVSLVLLLSYTVPHLPSSAGPRDELPPPERVPGGVEESPGRARATSGGPGGDARRRRPRPTRRSRGSPRDVGPSISKQRWKIAGPRWSTSAPGRSWRFKPSLPKFLRRRPAGGLGTRDGTSSSEVEGSKFRYELQAMFIIKDRPAQSQNLS